MGPGHGSLMTRGEQGAAVCICNDVRIKTSLIA